MHHLVGVEEPSLPEMLILASSGMNLQYGGFHSHGGSPIAGWFYWEIPYLLMDDGIGVPLWRNENFNLLLGFSKVWYILWSRTIPKKIHGASLCFCSRLRGWGPSAKASRESLVARSLAEQVSIPCETYKKHHGWLVLQESLRIFKGLILWYTVLYYLVQIGELYYGPEGYLVYPDPEVSVSS